MKKNRGGGIDDSQNENDENLDDDKAENEEEIEIEEPDKDDSQGTATYTIRFNANGAPLGSMSPQTKQTGETITLTPCGFWWGDTSSWETSDYKFLGWAISANSGNVRYQNMDTYSENLSRTLYAVWNYTIRFNGNGATSGSMSNQMKKHAVSLKLNTNNYKRTWGGRCLLRAQFSIAMEGIILETILQLYTRNGCLIHTLSQFVMIQLRVKCRATLN